MCDGGAARKPVWPHNSLMAEIPAITGSAIAGRRVTRETLAHPITASFAESRAANPWLTPGIRCMVTRLPALHWRWK